jgi:hypothetical protein
MSRFNTALQNDIKAIEFARDELKLQAHLFKAEVQERWAELETMWQQLSERLLRSKDVAGHALDEVETELQLLSETLKSGYSKLKGTLQR